MLNMQEDLKELIESNQYKLLRKLGEGGFGVVYSAIKVSTGEEVALKVMDLNKEKLLKTFHNEIGTTPSHPNIMSFSNYYLLKMHGLRYGVMEMEMMEIDLMDYLLNNGTLSEKDVRVIFKQVCEAVACCHQRQIYHLDIKADNVLLSRNSKGQYHNVKLCDFGHAKHVSQFRSNGHFGTPQYLPLEMFSKKYPIIAEKVDIWSLGVLLFTLLTGMFPFIINNQKNTIHCLDLNIVNQHCADNRCIDLLSAILVEDPSDRPDILDILSHPWIATKEYSYSYPLDGCVENYYYQGGKRDSIDNPHNSKTNSNNIDNNNFDKKDKKKKSKMMQQILKLKTRLSN